MTEYNKEPKCVCELKRFSSEWPVCDQPFAPCSADLRWCSNIGKDGTHCEHDEACHLTNKALMAQGEI